MPERMELAIFRDAYEDMAPLLAQGHKALHERELLRELGQRPIDRDDRPFRLVHEVDRDLPLDEPPVFVYHVPRLVLAGLLGEFEEGPVEIVLLRDEVLECRDADHSLYKPPVGAAERLRVERVPQEPDRDEGEPPTGKVQQKRVGPVDRDHVPRVVRGMEDVELRDVSGRQGHVPVVLHEELELPPHVVHVAHARISTRDSCFGVIVTRIRPGKRSATSARWVIRMTFSNTSPMRKSFWTKSSRETSVSRDPRSPSSMKRVFIRPNVRPTWGIDASSFAIAKRRAALIWVFSPPENSATSCHCPSTPWTRIRIPWPRPSSYVSRRIRLNRPSVSSERFLEASISSSGRSCSTAYMTTPRLWNTRFTRTSWMSSSTRSASRSRSDSRSRFASIAACKVSRRARDSR